MMGAVERPTTQHITDPQRIRALAHPVRLRLMDLLADGPLTATGAAELTGETVANCSFHLRTLAKYGYVEPAARTGRERPWQLVTPSTDIRVDPDQAGAATAVGGIALAHVDREVAHVRRWLERLDREPHEWIDASTVSNSTTWLTAEELAGLSRTIQELTAPFAGRNADPAKRPPGARPIRVFATTIVDTEREDRHAPPAP